jgi:hypothetical protein
MPRIVGTVSLGLPPTRFLRGEGIGMTRKAALSLDGLVALGAEKLAELILEEVEDNLAFAKRIKAALAGAQGIDAIASLIDRRLAALERARAMVDREKERAFAADLDATVDAIAGELGPRSPFQAVQRLLRFLDTHAHVFERIDDSGGRIQAVYWQASEAVPDLVQKLPLDERDWLPDRLLASLAKDTHGLARDVSIAVAPLLPAPVLAAWDDALRLSENKDSAILDVRQAIADARGDLDGYLALEARRPGWRQNPLAAAERLFAAGRLDEALAWVRREKQGGLAIATESDIADGRIRRFHDLEKVKLEARILEAKQNRQAAQALRWAAFETTLNADLLREYLRKLEDFIEYEEQERAFAVATASAHSYAALSFFLAWSRLDLAAKLVLDKRDVWDGSHYGALTNAAVALEPDFPVAATLIYRVLLDNILARAKSQAYGHGARHLARLTALAADVPEDGDLETHAAYLARIRQLHGRKAGFWSQVGGNR